MVTIPVKKKEIAIHTAHFSFCTFCSQWAFKNASLHTSYSPCRQQSYRCNATLFLLTCSADSDGSAQTCFQLRHDGLQFGSCKLDTDLYLEVNNLLVQPSRYVKEWWVLDISVGCVVDLPDRLLHLISNLYLKLFGLSFFVPMKSGMEMGQWIFDKF